MYIVYTVKYTLYSIHYTVYTIHYTMYIVYATYLRYAIYLQVRKQNYQYGVIIDAGSSGSR